MNERAHASDRVEATVLAGAGMRGKAKFRGRWLIECFDREGKLAWSEVIENLIVDEGLNHLLSATLAGGTQITTWYVGLCNATPSPAPGDIMTSHTGWTENQNYSEAARQTWTPGSVAGKSVSNSASKASFSINADSQSLGGAFLVSNSTKGGTTGTLYSCGAFSGGNKPANNGYTVQVTATFTSADDGV